MNAVSQKPRAMFIVPAHYKALEQKGVLWMLKQREELGYFSQISTIHMQAPKTQEILFSEVQTIYEYETHKTGAFRAITAVKYAAHLVNMVWQLSRMAKRQKIDFIRAQDPYISGLIGLLVSRICRIKFCVSIHSDYIQRNKLDPHKGAPKIFGSRKLAKYLEIFILKNAGLILPIRQTLAESYIQRGIKRDKIRIFTHALDLSPYKEKANPDVLSKIGIDTNKQIISFAGRFSKENYIYDYIELARRLPINENFLIVLAGNGAEEENIKKQISNDQTLQQNIYLTGSITSEQIRHLRSLSYINLAFMGGLSLIESCAAGRPVLSYDVEWHAELIQNDVSGFLIEEHNIDEVFDRIMDLINNPALATELGQNAQRAAFERHDVVNITAPRQKIYNELLDLKND